MAYFPNGTAFGDWQARNCYDCMNYRDNGSGSFGCAISDVHFLLDYHEGTNAAVLDQLIGNDDGGECQMRLRVPPANDGETTISSEELWFGQNRD